MLPVIPSFSGPSSREAFMSGFHSGQELTSDQTLQTLSAGAFVSSDASLNAMGSYLLSKQCLELGGADVSAAADEGDSLSFEAVAQVHRGGERGGAGAFDQRPCLLDHGHGRHVDLVVGHEDEVVEHPAKNSLRQLKGCCRR